MSKKQLGEELDRLEEELKSLESKFIQEDNANKSQIADLAKQIAEHDNMGPPQMNNPQF